MQNSDAGRPAVSEQAGPTRVRSGLIAVLVVVLAVTLGFVGGRVSADASGHATRRGARLAGAAHPTRPSNLFVVDAPDAWASARSDGAYDVSLRDARVLWFQDRPDRESGTISPKALFASWEKLFAGDPPNGSIVAEHQTSTPPAVEFAEARFDEATNTLTFRVSADEGQAASGLEFLGGLADVSAATNGRLSLFVDDAGLQTIAGCPMLPAGQMTCPYWNVPPGTDLSQANLQYAEFYGSNFTDVNLSGAYLWSSDFRASNFTGANLSGASVTSANFTGSNFTGTNFDQTLWCQTAAGLPPACVPFPNQ
jgi:hypothetical protein